MFWRTLSLIFLLSQICLASDNMLPLNSEKLDQPIELQCGLKIVEWSGDKEIDEKRLNELCDKAVKEFPKFLKTEKNIDVEFVFLNWHASFIDKGSCNRCLNDLKNRFKNREDKRVLSGYTDYNINHMFVGINDKALETIFVHELYHSITDYNGYLFSDEEDEKLARKFTRKLGLGE